MDNNETVCFCADKTKGDIVAAIKGGATTYEALQDAGISPNECCKAEVNKILKEEA